MVTMQRIDLCIFSRDRTLLSAVSQVLPC